MEFLGTGKKLQIIYEEVAGVSKTCLSKMLDFDDASILIEEPTYKGKFISIPVGTVLEVLVIDSKCVYTFNTSVIGKQKFPQALWISIPETYRRVQRREYARINIKLPVLVTIKPETLIHEVSFSSNIMADQIVELGYFNSDTIDVSGGGIKVFTPLLLQANSTVKCLLRLPMKEIITNAKVIRSFENDKINQREFSPEEFAKYNFITALAYKDIEDTDRSTLVQLCFKRQLELRQRGIT